MGGLTGDVLRGPILGSACVRDVGSSARAGIVGEGNLLKALHTSAVSDSITTFSSAFIPMFDICIAPPVNCDESVVVGHALAVPAARSTKRSCLWSAGLLFC